ncbi:hypothetical protein GUITHDRAFT_109900 [Guillardia theta CCMP2712]|uniref:PDZ domain-containing protein n=1 Tax=Guillardia theta (strain CCMP2712) TaxID=905079 RepID=L1J6Y8_GUITC|nr:hypothetical protein GUITHDRAFT_109900 [Guillardia theta CCMP2712]EKX44117.1 hypothetical protein GUITHDRAFT_109900 [Guillardia theta CCMP2712]|eukprot:XP_005831097.1 hypothetical protein GUITHDRAFT_109900 [Guillardia theta CCMP2712]
MSGDCGFSGREHGGGRGSQDLLCDGFERGKAVYDEHRFSVGSFSDEFVAVGMMSPRYLRSEMFSPRMIERQWTQEERQTQAGREGSVGVGLVLDQRGSQLLVHGFVRGSSSFACGTLEKGDILHMVDDVIVDGMPRSQIATLITGKVGTEVKLTFLRQETVAIMEKLAGDQEESGGYGFHPLVLSSGSPGVVSHRMRRVAPRYMQVKVCLTRGQQVGEYIPDQDLKQCSEEEVGNGEQTVRGWMFQTDSERQHKSLQSWMTQDMKVEKAQEYGENTS